MVAPSLLTPRKRPSTAPSPICQWHTGLAVQSCWRTGITSLAKETGPPESPASGLAVDEEQPVHPAMDTTTERTARTPSLGSHWDVLAGPHGRVTRNNMSTTSPR